MPDEKKYKVTGILPVLEHDPGETFTATLRADQENTLIQAGAIEIVSDKSSSSETTTSPKPSTGSGGKTAADAKSGGKE